MKRLWYALVLVILALGVCFFEYFSVKNCYDNFLYKIDQTRTFVENGEYEKANEVSREMKNDWNTREKRLNYILEHTVMDELSKDISELPDYTDKESKDDFLSVNDRIKKQLTSLYTSERPIGENIF